MSADRRKKILMVFGGLAVVLVVVIALVRPSFKSDDAIGAIGAVQKHRAPQIAQKDVILGDEQTKKQQQVLYSDFLADSAALQSINANMSTASRTESASRLAARSEDLRARYVNAARDQVAGMKAYYAKDSLDMKKLESLDSDLAAAASRAQSRDDVSALNARLDSAFASLDSTLRARDNKLAEADVAGLASRIQARENVDGIRSTMAQASASLDARNNASAIRDREQYLSAMAKESATLQSAEQALSAGSRTASAVQNELGSAAHDLAQRALVNMRSNFASQSQTAESLSHMAGATSAMNKAAASRSDAPLGFRDEVAAFGQRIQARSSEAQSRFNYGMNTQLVGMSAYLASAAKYDARTASAADFASYLGVLSHAAQSRDQLYASVLGSEDFVAQSKALYKQADQLQSMNLKQADQLQSISQKSRNQ
ncbi:MAG TPA: hypothetical protein VF505_20290 [Thermoanaerobaculia bacterium]